MVFGWLSTLAMDTISHVAGESPVVFAEKEFDRFMKSYEFAIEAQKLKREDVRDLVELIVSRMDMYHLVGALLLEFCIAFYGEFKLLEEEYHEEPCFILEIFLLSNICAIGYLLFAVWLSLHASVAAHAIGVEFLLDSSRLTIPSPENLKQMRQSTSVFRHIYHMFADAAQTGRQGAQRFRSGGSASPSASSLPGLPEDSMAIDVVRPHTETAHIQGQGTQLKVGPGKLPLALDSALDTMEHRHSFAQSHRCWLRFDAYSRVCMALGINQMLQALSYFIVGPVQRRRPSAALISLCAVQTVALLLLKLDLRNTEADPSRSPQAVEPEDSDDSDSSKLSHFSFLAVGSKDVSVASYRDLLLTLSTFTLAPLWTTLALWANRFTMHEQLLSISVTPCFFLHAMWLFLVLKTISPQTGDLLPQRLRTVGYLDIFTKDIVDEQPAAAAARAAGGGRRRAAQEEDNTPESFRPLRSMTTVMNQSPTKHHSHHAHSAEKVPWEVVNRFTMTVICMWVVGGIVHFAHTIYPHLEQYEADLEEQEQEMEMEGRARRLKAAWPEPASFFEVTSLHCNDSHVTFSSPIGLHSAQRLVDDAELGPLVETRGLAAHSLLCRENGSCDALVAYQDGPNMDGSSSWQLEPYDSSCLEGDPNQTVELPQAWRMAAGAWLPCSAAPCDAALLAGWDGTRIVIADLWRGSQGAAWSIEPRFAVRPGLGELSCRAAGGPGTAGSGGAPCNESEPGDYGDVQAMQLSVHGACQTLTVLRNGTLDGWDLDAGRKIGSWRVKSTLQTTMCHDGRHLMLAHPGDEGPVVEAIPLPAALANCSSPQWAGPAEAAGESANESVAELGRAEHVL